MSAITPRPFQLGNLAILDARHDLRHGYGRRDLRAITEFIVHHSATPALPPDATIDAELAAIKSIHAYHSNPNWPAKGDGGPGIAYNLVLFQSGRCYYTGDLASIRWHSGGNHNVTGAALLYQGAYANVWDAESQTWIVVPPPPDSMVDQGVVILNECRLALNNGQIPAVGHQDVSSTRCPGDWWPDHAWRFQPGAPAPDMAAPDVVTPAEALRIQLDTLWGLAEQIDGEYERRIKDAVIAINTAPLAYAPSEARRIQLDTLWGLAEQIDGQYEHPIKNAAIAIKDAAAELAGRA